MPGPQSPRVSAIGDTQTPVSQEFRRAMRKVAASVTIVTTRDSAGSPHGMAASGVIPVSMDPPSMLVAVNRSASLHPVLQHSRRFCVNVLADDQHDLIAPFSQSALRAQRFKSDNTRDRWQDDPDLSPYLESVPAAIFCEVDSTIDYGTHTLFIGRVTQVNLPADAQSGGVPLIWLDGRRAALA